MIVPEVMWRYSPNSPSPPLRVQWGEWHLFTDHVLGILNKTHWFCLERATGNLLWQKSNMGRPNTIKGLQGNIIIATEHRYDGPRAADLGVYGIRLDTQELLWTSHAPRRWGRFLRFLDFIPDFANEFRDTPALVRDNQVITQGGRILDVFTGKEKGSLEWTDKLVASVHSPTINLTFDKYLDCGTLGTLYLGTPEEPEEPEELDGDMPLQLYLKKGGRIAWEFDASRVTEMAGQGRTSFEYFEPYLYLLSSDKPLYVDTAVEEGLKYNTVLFTLWSLDIRTGQLVQKVPINKEPAILCSIEDGDENNLLLSYQRPEDKYYTVSCFARTKFRDGNGWRQELGQR